MREIGDGVSGLNAVRWGDIETSPPTKNRHSYNWEKLDFIVESVERTGRVIQINVLVDNPWSIERTNSSYLDPVTCNPNGLKVRIKPEFLQAWYQFIKTLVERYDGDGIDDMPNLRYPVIRYVQIGSEEGNAWIDPEGYLQALQLAYQAVKEADPKVRVLAPGFNLGPWLLLMKESSNLEFSTLSPRAARKLKFVKLFLKRGRPYFDVLTLHLNSSYRVEELIPYTLLWFKTEMKRYGYTKPIWIDDMMSGLNLAEITSTHEEREILFKLVRGDKETVKWYWKWQSVNLVKKSVLAFSYGAERVFISTDVDWIHYGTVDRPVLALWRFQGLVTVDGIRKPAFYTYKLLVEHLRDFKKAEPVLTGVNGVYLYSFQLPDSKLVLIGWCHQSTKSCSLNMKRYLPYDNYIVQSIITELDDSGNPVLPERKLLPAEHVQLLFKPSILSPVQ